MLLANYLGLMKHLATHDIACPDPMPNRDGKLLSTLNGRPAALVTRLTGREQMPGEIEARRQTELVGRDTEQRLELTDEVKRRDAYFAGEILDRQWMLALFEQQLASAAEPAEPLMSEQPLTQV